MCEFVHVGMKVLSEEFYSGILPSTSQKLHDFTSKLPAKLEARLFWLQAWELVCVCIHINIL